MKSRLQPLRPWLWVLVGLGLLYLVAVHWWWTAPMLAMGEQIRALRDEELDLRMEAEQVPQLRARLEALQMLEAGNPGFLAETTPALASAALIERLETEVRAASPNPVACEIIARTPMESTSTETFPRVTVQVRLRCGVAELGRVLQALEEGHPRLFIDNVDVRGLAGFFSGDQALRDTRVEVVFDLHGYLRVAVGAEARDD